MARPIPSTLLAALVWLALIKVCLHSQVKIESQLQLFVIAVRYLQSGQGESAIVCGANTHSW